MSKVDSKRKVEDQAINRITSLLQDQGHIVQKIDGHNDFGEDLYVSFVEDGATTGDTIAVQVKGGTSYRSAKGYRVAIKQHKNSWINTNVPVVCVVYDPDTGSLYWSNASEQLRRGKGTENRISSIKISRTDILDEDSVQPFVRNMRGYVAERGQLRHALCNLSGHIFDTTDYIAYFMNEYGEEIVFRQRRGEDVATLMHSDWNWSPIEVEPEALTPGDRAAKLGLTTVSQLADHLDLPEELRKLSKNLGDTDLIFFMDKIPAVGKGFVVNEHELAWLRVCAKTSSWWRSAPA